MAFRFNYNDSTHDEVVEHDIVIEFIDGLPVEITADKEGENHDS